jgi:hypothetical protein
MASYSEVQPASEIALALLLESEVQWRSILTGNSWW